MRCNVITLPSLKANFINCSEFSEQWEKELEAELNEYEVVAGKAGDDKWEKECEELLGDDLDLK